MNARGIPPEPHNRLGPVLAEGEGRVPVLSEGKEERRGRRGKGGCPFPGQGEGGESRAGQWEGYLSCLGGYPFSGQGRGREGRVPVLSGGREGTPFLARGRVPLSWSGGGMECINNWRGDISSLEWHEEFMNSALSVHACALTLSTISHVLSKINMATSDSALSVQPCGCSSPKQIIWWQTESG